MNKENLNILLEHLESIKEEEWSMSIAWGTCGCYMHHARFILGLENSDDVLKDALGLEERRYDRLVMPNVPGEAKFTCKTKTSNEFVSLRRAITVLENLIETGEVDWSIR